MSQQDLAAGTSAAEPVAKKAAPPWLWDLLLLGALWGASFLFMRIGAREFVTESTPVVPCARQGLMALHWLPHAQDQAVIAHFAPLYGHATIAASIGLSDIAISPNTATPRRRNP